MKPCLKLDVLRRSLARLSMIGFVKYTYPQYLMGWCHEEICGKLEKFLEDVRHKKSPRLMICMPPRSGKSELGSRRFPAYVFGRYPNMSIIATSYSSDLASRMNRDVQKIIDSDEFRKVFPEVQLSGKRCSLDSDISYQRNTEIFEIVNHTGSYRSAGVGTGITGLGGDIMILDDPIKSRQDADSPTVRKSVYDWYTSTFYTRLAAGGGVLAIATRWHADDLLGRLRENERSGDGDRWEKIDYPAIATVDERYRKIGEPLHPQRYSLEHLQNIKKNIGTRDWEALYQQHPTIEGGGIFKKKWLKYYVPADLPSFFDEEFLSWDMSFKDGDDKDFVVGQAWGRKSANFYLLEQVRGQWNFIDTLRELIDQTKRYPRAISKLIEDKANGPAVISTLQSSIMGLKAIEPYGSKIARAHAITPIIESGNLYLPHRHLFTWVDDYVLELCNFPAAANDDQVDATTQALKYGSEAAINLEVWEKAFGG